MKKTTVSKCSYILPKTEPKCVNIKPNQNPLKINFETMEVKLGNVSLGKIKGLIVGNDKITQTITFSDEYYNETYEQSK